MNPLERKVTKRELLAGGVAFIGGIFAAACSRPPEAKPTQPPLLPQASGAPKPAEELVESGWARYTHNLFKIDVPVTWKSSVDLRGARFASNEKAGSSSRQPAAFIEIALKESPEMSFDDYAQKYLKELWRRGTIPGRATLPYCVTCGSRENETTVDGQRALLFDFETPEPILGYLQGYYETRISFLRKGNAWVIAFAGDKSARQRMTPIFEKMLSSLKFIQ